MNSPRNLSELQRDALVDIRDNEFVLCTVSIARKWLTVFGLEQATLTLVRRSKDTVVRLDEVSAIIARHLLGKVPAGDLPSGVNCSSISPATEKRFRSAIRTNVDSILATSQ